MPLPRSGLKARVAPRRSLAGAAPIPKSYLAAGVGLMGAMTYALLREDSDARNRRKVPSSAEHGQQAASSSTDAAASAPILTLDGQYVSAANVPKYVLANSGLDQEQKLHVALTRRQAWLRAAQLAPTLALWGYAACVLVDATGLTKLPRGSRTAVPLGAAVVGGVLGSYWGGLEGKPFMNAALMARPVEHVHKRRSERPPEEDALVHFLREARDGRANATR